MIQTTMGIDAFRKVCDEIWKPLSAAATNRSKTIASNSVGLRIDDFALLQVVQAAGRRTTLPLNHTGTTLQTDVALTCRATASAPARCPERQSRVPGDGIEYPITRVFVVACKRYAAEWTGAHITVSERDSL
jgi:hypothetical protein